MTEPSAQERDSLIGSRIDGRYTVHRELGRGGMGVVYEGVHDELGRPVAIKVLNTAWASDPTAVARFLREARVASSFSHGNIVDVQDLGRLPDGRPFLVMPKIVGTDLAALLAKSGVQPAKRVAQLLTGVAAALDLIHAKGFVHRDIKPENLMYVVREDGSETVMLLDFGIAAAVMSNEPRLTGQGAIFGTPQFMPPEVCNGGMPDARGDVYALATVAFELITGHLPFGDDNMMRVLTAKLTSDPPALSDVSEIAFPAELEEVISRGLARNPDERFPSASEFIASLKQATEHAPVSWKSGVLRPSLRSDAHRVGSYKHPSDRPGESRTPSGRPIDPRTPSGRPRSSPAPGTTYTPAPPRSHRAPAGSSYETYPSTPPRSSRPRSQPPLDYPEHHWSEETYDRDSELGAGLRESERRRTSSVGRVNNGWRVALLSACLAALIVVWWSRERPGSIPGLPVPSGTSQSNGAIQPGVLAPAAPQPPSAAASPEVPANPASAPTSPATAAAQLPATPQPPAAAAPAAPDPPATVPPAAAVATPPSSAAPAAPLPNGASVPSVALRGPVSAPTAPAAKTPTVAAPRAPAAVPAPRPGLAVDPPAPEAAEPAAPADPVLVVQETEPAVEPEPELPVRPPGAQAAQLAREATSALLAGEVGHAIDLLREATRLDPSHALAWRTLGLALERSGNAAEALTAYQQYIRLAPHGPQADMVRERMQALER